MSKTPPDAKRFDVLAPVRRLSSLLRYGAPDASGDDLAAFERYAEQVSWDVFRYFVPFLLAIALLFWPTDTILYSDPAISGGLTRWRLTQVAILATAYLVAHASRAARDNARATLAVTCLVSFGFSAHAVTTIPNGNASTELLVLGPFAATVILVSARTRAAFLTALTGVVLAGVCLGNTNFPNVAIFAASLVAAALTALVIGHAIYYLFVRNFFQQRSIERTAERLAEVDRMKTEFFANVSHELRTPLTLILGSLRSVAATPGAAVAADAIATAHRNARRLLLLVNEILELARVAAEQGPRRSRAVDLAAMLRRIAGDFDSASGGRRAIALVGLDAPAIVKGDPERLKKVFYNLLSNAMKFTDVERRAIRVELAANDREVIVRVVDNGIGIAEEDLERIFERFVQVESDASRRYEGAGIGLALVKGIVTQAGGTVEAQSKRGEGATFVVTLPRGDVAVNEELATLDDDADDAPLVESIRGAPVSAAIVEAEREDRSRVVIVEDNADLRAYTTNILARRYRVRAAKDGAEALELTKSWRPDLVVTDVMMPVMSGVDLLRAIRADDELRATPVVFLTARAGVEARSEALEGGADDYVAKPFEERELVARVENLLVRARQTKALAAMNEELEAGVKERTTELTALAAHLADVLERERARIAREIHDDFGQTLAAMRLEVDHASRGAMREGELAETATRLSRLLDATLTSTRRILAELRPQGLEEFGLIAAVERLAAEFGARHACALDLSLDPDFDTDAKRGTAVFRILQECLNNVAKHASAKRVEIALTLDGDLIRLVVRDDGRGLAEEKPRAGAMGLVGMRERALSFGGRVTIAGGAGRGTTVDVVIPTHDREPSVAEAAL